jgi:hypothetical protein
LNACIRGLLAAALLGGAGSALAAQEVFRQFSYDELRPTALQVDLGLLGASRLRSAVTGGVRLEYGRIAPRVRLLLGLSYYRSRFSAAEISRLVTRIRELVDDPDDNFTVDVGIIRWSDITGDLDLQYVLPQGGALTAYLGLGVSVHLRDGSGAAIAGTFLEDALDDVAAGINGTLGLELNTGPHWVLTLDARGVLLTNHSTASLRGGLMYRFRGRP